VQEAREVIGAVSQELAASDADEEVEELARHRVRIGRGRLLREADMGEPERAHVALQLRDAREHVRGRGTPEQHREQAVLVRAQEIDLVESSSRGRDSSLMG
jgi:hypothetical protein